MASLLRAPRKNEKRSWRDPSGDPEEFRLTLVEHLEELRTRIINSLLIITVAWIIGWYLEKPVYGYLDQMVRDAVTPVLPKGYKFQEVFHNATEPFFLKMKLSFAIALILSFPLLVLQLWGFIAPGLKTKERKPFNRLAPYSLLLFALGAYVGWLALPGAFRWFATYVEEFPGTSLLQEAGTMTFFILKMLLAFGIGFQVPLVVYVLGALELLSAETLLKYWRQSATAIFVIAMIVTPSQDPMTMLLMAIPMTILFVVSVYAVKFVQDRKRKKTLDEPPTFGTLE